MWGRLAMILGLVTAIGLLGACGPTTTKGTMPPPGPDGEMDPSQVPDFIGVAAPDGGIAGWVPKSYLLDGPSFPDAADIPVYADDLRTLIGHMVAGKGFVPLGVDPAAIPDLPVVAGPSVPGVVEDADVVVYARNGSGSTAWLAVQVGATFAEGSGFVGGIGAACLEVPDGGTVVFVDRSLSQPGVRAVKPLAGPGEARWVDIAADGTITEGEGIPDWWVGPPPC
jgi:hypothetical protein